jgi:hypothetical protein
MNAFHPMMKYPVATTTATKVKMDSAMRAALRRQPIPQKQAFQKIAQASASGT